jgi:hypothetical protein
MRNIIHLHCNKFRLCRRQSPVNYFHGLSAAARGSRVVPVAEDICPSCVGMSAKFEAVFGGFR